MTTTSKSKEMRAKTDAFVDTAVAKEYKALLSGIDALATKGESKFIVENGMLSQAEGVCKLLVDDGFGYKFEPNGDLIIRW